MTSAACWYLLVPTGPPATAVIRKTRSLPQAVSRFWAACIGLADIERFLAAPAAAVIDRWLADLAAETGVRRRALDALAFALGFGTSLPKEPAMAVIIRPVDSALSRRRLRPGRCRHRR
jgi:hypothetical protein